MVTDASADGEAPLHSYRCAAAVLSTFESEQLRPLDTAYDGDSDAVLDLLDECERVRDATGARRWMLKNSARRQALLELGTTEAIRRALDANRPHPTDALQQMLVAIVERRTPALDQLTTAELSAALQIHDWVDGIVEGPPSRTAIIDRLEWMQLLQPLRDLVGDHFRGRAKELADLRVFFDSPERYRSVYQARPLMIFGPGGVGKSTLIAKFTLGLVDEVQTADVIFCYWDFDRPTLLPEEPLTLLAELVYQIGLRFTTIKAEAHELRRHWLAQLAESASLQTPTKDVGKAAYRDFAQRAIFQQRSDLPRHLRELRQLLGELPGSKDIRLLLVLDTFERVQEVSFEFTVALWDFLNELQAILPLMRVIVAGRAQLNDAIAHQPYELKELDEEAAKGYLTWRGVNSPQLTDAIYRRVGGDPLSLRLAVDGLQQDHPDLAQLEELPVDFNTLSIDHELNQGWLYRRYLARIRDEPIRQLAHPGLVLRRVTPALIREVLAVPCGVAVPDDETAEDLFERLAQQASLVTREGPQTLRHRSDIRRRMLRSLMQTEGGAVFDIHSRAIDYYARQPESAEARAEEIYHRLFIARSRDEIDERWLLGIAPLLRDAVDEVPRELRSYLIVKLEISAAAFEWDEADARSKEDFVVTRAEDALAVIQPEEALRLLGELRERLPGSRLYHLEAQALERLGRYSEVLLVANEGRFSARKAGDALLECNLLLAAVRAHITLGQYRRAAGLLDDLGRLPLELPGDQPDLLDLELRMHRLRLCRLDPSGCREDVAALRKETYERLEPLLELAARQNALLVLGLAEELGIAFPEALTRTVGAFPSLVESLFDTPIAWRQLARLLRDLESDSGGRIGELVEHLETGTRDQAMQTAGLTPPGDWDELLRRVFQSAPPTQPFVSGLVSVLRTSLIRPPWQETDAAHLLDKVRAALLSAFPSREDILVFLWAEFPEEIVHLPLATTYLGLLTNVVMLFERWGKTEALVKQALEQNSQNAELQKVVRDLRNATEAAPAILGGQEKIDKRARTYITGEVLGSVIQTSGPLFITGNVRDTVFNVSSRSVPPDVLAALPKVMPPFSTAVAQEPILASPELVFNWALGMRQAMRAVCLMEGLRETGTSFLVAPDLLLYTIQGSQLEPLLGSRLRFDYVESPSGRAGQPTVYTLAPDPLIWSRVFWYPESGQFTTVLMRLEGTPGLDIVPGESFRRGWLSLTAAPVVAHQNMFILHHGFGRQQMLEYATAQPTSDGGVDLATLSGRMLPGAGGAPCFNESWQVVALRMGTVQPAVWRNQMTVPPMMVIWSRELLGDAEFVAALKAHLPMEPGGPSDPETHQARLRQIINDHFTFEDLRMLAFELAVDWESLSGETRSAKATELVALAERHGQLGALIQRGSVLRPDIRWE